MSSPAYQAHRDLPVSGHKATFQHPQSGWRWRVAWRAGLVSPGAPAGAAVQHLDGGSRRVGQAEAGLGAATISTSPHASYGNSTAGDATRYRAQQRTARLPASG